MTKQEFLSGLSDRIDELSKVEYCDSALIWQSKADIELMEELPGPPGDKALDAAAKIFLYQFRR